MKLLNMVYLSLHFVPPAAVKSLESLSLWISESFSLSTNEPRLSQNHYSRTLSCRRYMRSARNHGEEEECTSISPFRNILISGYFISNEMNLLQALVLNFCYILRSTCTNQMHLINCFMYVNYSNFTELCRRWGFGRFSPKMFFFRKETKLLSGPLGTGLGCRYSQDGTYQLIYQHILCWHVK